MPKPPPLPTRAQRQRLRPGLPSVPAPAGMVYWGEFKLAGVSHEGRRDILRKIFNDDADWTCFTQPEPKNEHDPNAIGVWAQSGRQKYHIGYIPKQIAAAMRGFQSLGITPRVFDPDGNWLLFDLFHSEARQSGKNGCGCLLLIAALPLGLGGMALTTLALLA